MESTHRWHPLVREWERTLRAENKSKNTIQIYGHCTRLMIKWLDALPTRSSDPDDVLRPDTPDQITRAHIATWMSDLLASGTPGNANNKYRSVQQWFNWLLAEGEIEVHPMARMKPPLIPEKPIPLVLGELIRKELDQGRDLMSRRDMAIIRLTWDTGARLSEIAALKLDDVDLDSDVIHMVGKGRRAPGAAGSSGSTRLGRTQRIRLPAQQPFGGSSRTSSTGRPIQMGLCGPRNMVAVLTTHGVLTSRCCPTAAHEPGCGDTAVLHCRTWETN